MEIPQDAEGLSREPYHLEGWILGGWSCHKSHILVIPISTYKFGGFKNCYDVMAPSYPRVLRYKTTSINQNM